MRRFISGFEGGTAGRSARFSASRHLPLTRPKAVREIARGTTGDIGRHHQRRRAVRLHCRAESGRSKQALEKIPCAGTTSITVIACLASRSSARPIVTTALTMIAGADYESTYRPRLVNVGGDYGSSAAPDHVIVMIAAYAFG